MQLVRIQGPAGLFSERLSVFVFFDDSDGTTDFNSITLTHNDTGLTWTILPENTQVRLLGKDRWLGSNSLAGPGEELIPAGSYTLTVSDLAGNEAVKTFEITRPEFPEYAPVSFSIEDGNWTLVRNAATPGFTRTYLFLLSGQSDVLFSWLVPDGTDGQTTGTVASLQSMARKAVQVQCYTANDDGSAGVLLTPVDLQ